MTELACELNLTRIMISALRCLRFHPVVAHRCLSTRTDGELRIAQVLKDKFPSASLLKVVDISGGCGAMYEIHIESSEFKGKRTVQQHQLVNQALKEEIQGMHGLRIFTDVPKQ